MIAIAKGQKAKPRSEWAESTRKAQKAWMRENRVQLSTNVPKDIGDAFRAYCKDHGKTVSAVLAEYVRDVLRSYAGSTDASEDPKNAQEEKDC